MVKVSKFGGSSVSCAEQFKKVKNIVESDNQRKFVIVSAAGKAFSEDNKITDLLYLCYAHIKYNISADNIFDMIKNKFIGITTELNLKFDIIGELEKLKSELNKNIDEDYLVSRGEYITGLLMAEYLNYKFIDPKDLIFFKYSGKIDYEKSQKAFDEAIKSGESLLIPGFYGSLPNGEIKIMSRGGGDVTGAIVANLANASVYENWTDVSGVLMADPRIVKNPKGIKEISYEELRELSYMGFSVLHEEAIFPAKIKDIPIQIRNTNDPQNEGTTIKNENTDKSNTITGIAGKKDFSIITVRKNYMSNEIGLISKALTIFEEYGVSIEHLPTGIDSFSIIVETASIKPFVYELLSKLKKITKAQEVTVIDGIALIATVGVNMKNSLGTSGKLFSALGEANVNIVVISQPSDEINIVVGVHNEDFEKTIETIYKKFIK